MKIKNYKKRNKTFLNNLTNKTKIDVKNFSLFKKGNFKEKRPENIDNNKHNENLYIDILKRKSIAYHDNEKKQFDFIYKNDLNNKKGLVFDNRLNTDTNVDDNIKPIQSNLKCYKRSNAEIINGNNKFVNLNILVNKGKFN